MLTIYDATNDILKPYQGAEKTLMTQTQLIKPVIALWMTAIVMTVFTPVMASAGDVQVIDRIVAIVNNDVISLDDLNTRLKPYLEKIKSMGYPSDKERQMVFKVRDEILGQLIDQKLTDQEIAKNKITVSDTEVDSAIERVKKSSSYTDEDLRRALAKDGMTMAEYRKRVKEQLLRAALINREIKSKVVVTKEDIKAYYASHPELHDLDDKYHLENIYVVYPENMDAGLRGQYQKKMEDILKELKAGKALDEVLKASSGGQIAVKGGDLGSFTLTSLNPKIQDALKTMKPGDYSGIIETDQGCQIIQLKDITKAASGEALNAANTDVENKLYKEMLDKKFVQWLDDLRSKSTIKIIQ